MHCLIDDFIKGVKPRAPEEISHDLSLPVRTVHDCLDQLRVSELVTQLWDEADDRYVYQPATDINRMTLSFVLEKMESAGSIHKIVVNNTDYKKIDLALNKFETMISSSETNILLRDI
jgi:hypothetical protein